MKWNNSAAKRLAQISANGGTPLAEVYDRMLPVLASKKPDIFIKCLVVHTLNSVYILWI